LLLFIVDGHEDGIIALENLEEAGRILFEQFEIMSFI
jgi:hypothetical protein